MKQSSSRGKNQSNTSLPQEIRKPQIYNQILTPEVTRNRTKAKVRRKKYTDQSRNK